jgi:putative hydrolase of the HAD superfamily
MSTKQGEVIDLKPSVPRTERVILWDFDGTLAFREGGWSGLVVDIVRQFDSASTVRIEDVRPYMRTGFPWHSPEVVRDPPHSADAWWSDLDSLLTRAFEAAGVSSACVEGHVSLFRACYLQPAAWQVYPDVLDALREMSELGWTQGILSNHVPELETLVASLGLNEHISRVFSSGCIGCEKPNRILFEHALRQLGYPEQVWMVGDNYHADIVGAETLNVPSILVRNFHPDAPQFCPTLRDVPKIIESSLGQSG